MSITLGLLFMFTVLMGGFLAYYGDVLGSRYGKRRARLFGLRPKYTAMLITSATGTAISALTIATLYMVSPSIRNIILQGQAAIEMRPILERNNVELKSLQGQLKRDIDASKAHVKEQTRQLEAGHRQLSTQREQLKVAGIKLAEAKKTLASLRETEKSLLALNNALKTSNSLLTSKNEYLTVTNATLNKNKLELTKQNAELAKNNAYLAALNDEQSSRNVDLIRERTKLERETLVLMRTGNEQRLLNIELKTTNDQLQHDNQRMLADNVRLVQENKTLSDLLKRFAPGYESLVEAYMAARNKRVAIHREEDLGRVVVPPNSNHASVIQMIDSLLHDAGESAIKLGASVGDGARAVRVLDKQLFARDERGGVVQVEFSSQERIDTVVSRLVFQTEPCVVLARAVANSLESEPAAIDFELYTNRKVYVKGEVIYVKTLNGNHDSTVLFEEVVAFLRELGAESRSRGLIPHTEGARGESQVGTVSGPDVVRLVEQLRERGGQVKLRAVAAKDLMSADSLEVTFLLRQ